jgi:ribonuclease HI
VNAKDDALAAMRAEDSLALETLRERLLRCDEELAEATARIRALERAGEVRETQLRNVSDSWKRMFEGCIEFGWFLDSRRTVENEEVRAEIERIRERWSLVQRDTWQKA